MLELNNSNPPVQFTIGSHKRAIAINRLLECVTKNQKDQAELSITSVVILAKKEWQSSVSFKYGLANSKIYKGLVTVLVPANYPTKFIHQFDNYILLSARKNLFAKGSLHEFFDILVLYEAIRSTLSYKNKNVYLQNSAAASRFWLLLKKLKTPGISERVLSWVLVFNEHFDEKYLKLNRNRLALKDRLVLDCHFLALAIDQLTSM